MLYLIATPIGHLADFSERAIATIRNSDLVLCEDTRHSKILLRHHQIDRPLLSFHQFNELQLENRILSKLEAGQTLSLLSDAGTPLISDPGYSLVQACIKRGLPFTAIPGPCSIIQALVLSGFETARFQFIGFLPRDQGPLTELLRRALFYPGTTISFESPQRILKTLEVLAKLDPNRPCAIARELTKLHEECRRGTASELLFSLEATPPRGEIVLLIREASPPEEEIGTEEFIALIQETLCVSLKEAIKLAARLKGVSKRSIYQHIHK